MKHIQYLFLLFFALTLSLTAQEKVILKQTYIKVKEGNNHAQDLNRKFSKLAQKRIDAGYSRPQGIRRYQKSHDVGLSISFIKKALHLEGFFYTFLGNLVSCFKTQR